MKHRVTIAVCLVAIVVVGILSVQTYNNYKTKHESLEALEAKQSVLVVKDQAEQQATFKAEVNNLEAICQKDLASWQTLTAAQKAKTPAPNCSLQFVQ